MNRRKFFYFCAVVTMCVFAYCIGTYSIVTRVERDEEIALERAALERGDAKNLAIYAKRLGTHADWPSIRQAFACDVFRPGRTIAQVDQDLRGFDGFNVEGPGVYPISSESLWYKLRKDPVAASTRILEARVRVDMRAQQFVERAWFEGRAFYGYIGPDEMWYEPLECTRPSS